MIRKLLLLYLLCSFHYGLTQSALWKAFDPKELKGSTAICFAQDKSGILWIGTQTGLMRYNGRTFTTIPTSTSEHPYLTSIAIDKSGNIYAGSRSGLWKYTLRSGDFSRLPENKNFQIHDINWSADSTQLLIASSHGLHGYAKGKWTALYETGKPCWEAFPYKNGIVTNTGSRIVFVENGHATKLFEYSNFHDVEYYAPHNSFLIATNDGLFEVAPGQKFAKKYDVRYHLYLNAQDGFYIDGRNRLWINTQDTLYQFTGPNDQTPVKHYWSKGNPHSVAEPVGFYMDREHNMWVSSIGNKLHLLPERFEGIYYCSPSEFGTEMFWASYYDRTTRQHLVGTNEGLIIYRNTGQLSQGRKLPNPPGANRFTPVNISEYDPENWLICSYGYGSWLLNKRTLSYTQFASFNKIYDCLGIHRLSKDTCLVMAIPGIYYRHRNGSSGIWPVYSGLSNLSWTQTSSGQLYLCNYEGLIRIDRKSGRLTKLNKEVPQLEKWINSAIFCMLEGADRMIYFGTLNDGLVQYDPVHKKMRTIQLLNHPAAIYGIVRLNDQELLLTSNKGIYRYSLRTGKSRNFNATSNNLPFDDFNQVGYSRQDNMISLCGSDGMIYGDAGAFERLFGGTIRIQLEQNGRVTNSLTCEPGKHFMEVTVTTGIGSILLHPGVSYRIKGLETTWHDLDESGIITYNYLPSGSYELEIRLNDPNGLVASQRKVFALEVIPAWYQTWWFLTLIYALSIAIVALLVRYFVRIRLRWKIQRMESEQRVYQERIRISRELHDNVGSQLSHLIMGLEASEMMVQQSMTDALTENLGTLQDSARESMQQLRDAIWTLNSDAVSIQDLATRFEQWCDRIAQHAPFRVHFRKNFTTDYELDPLQTLHVFRILQECVHNIIKHAKASEVAIDFETSDKAVVITVADNGKGFDPESSNGNGLGNMKLRAQEIGAVYSLETNTGKGTRVRLEFSR